jgi:hypothetical protein
MSYLAKCIFIGAACTWIITIGALRCAWCVIDYYCSKVDRAVDRVFEGWL